MKTLASLLFCLFFSLTLSAQSGPSESLAPNTGGLSGQLLEENTGEPIGFANVAIYNVTGDLVAGTTSDIDGTFVIKDLPYGDYRLEMSFIGYATEDRQLELSEAKRFFELDAIALGPDGQQLEEVIVTAERAVMELGLDRKVFNVEKTIAAAGGSAEDLLRQIPSITVDLEGNVSLRGNGNVRFLINGRPSGLTGANQQTFLQSLTAANIERIEVITNPGARFDPDGTGGLINIVLKNKTEDGFNATVNLNAGTNNKFDGSLDANWRKGKFNTTFGISGRSDERFFRGYREQEATFADTSFSRIFTFDGNRMRQSQLLKLGTEYAINDRSTFQISGNYQLSSGDNGNLRTTTFFDENNNSAFTSIRTEREPNDETDYEIRANYQTTFRKEGRQLTGALQFSDSNEEEIENYREVFSTPEGVVYDEILQNSPTLSGRKQFLGQLDYEQKIGEFKLETGWRSTLQRLDNLGIFNEFDETIGDFVKIDSNSNRFFYDEDIHALYATFGGKVDKLVFSAGLRAEQAYTTSRLTEPNVETFENDYFKVYPSVFLGYEVAEGSTIQASYSRRVNRPRSWDLNPFVDRGDPLNLRTGNPFLLPELINSFELNLQQRFGAGTFTGGFYYRQLNDLITRVTETLPGGVSLGTRANLDRGRDYGVEVITTLRPSEKLDFTLSLNAYRSEIDGQLAEGTVDANGYLFNGRLQGGYELPWDITTQFTYFYRSPGITPQGRIRAIQSLDLGFRKPVLNDKGAITLRVSDLFNQRRFRFTTDVGGLFTDSEFQRESRIVYLGFQYSLRQVKQKGRERQGGDRDQNGGGGDDF
ncbi:TonB-dependent receptor [Neolewinella lacunae]|uniref:TonB-dependent receptor n=1 Tax=Neolewinella lacunae TaxID=1517758 RepID=A0A923PQD9_9BACT|nr:TonB-dependent receptor [Neolewinella lacunae]MBC6995523.1 TonB-dependent receptor [Neolewinella lacunae]MDN3635111.1 TonB-dependent receptor [Neolewinella lacunae]